MIDRDYYLHEDGNKLTVAFPGRVKISIRIIQDGNGPFLMRDVIISEDQGVPISPKLTKIERSDLPIDENVEGQIVEQARSIIIQAAEEMT